MGNGEGGWHAQVWKRRLAPDNGSRHMVQGRVARGLREQPSAGGELKGRQVVAGKTFPALTGARGCCPALGDTDGLVPCYVPPFLPFCRHRNKDLSRWSSWSVAELELDSHLYKSSLADTVAAGPGYLH